MSGRRHDLGPRWVDSLARVARRERVSLLAVALGFGLVPTVAFAASARVDFWGAIGVTGALGLAAALTGSLIGFLFGVPKWRTSDTGDKAGYLPNTNLEQVSDWLTKILVGVGLTQFGPIGDALGRLVAAAGDGLGGGPSATLFAGGLLVYCAVVGLLAGFIFTALFLASEFRERAEPIGYGDGADTVGSNGVGLPSSAEADAATRG